MRYHNREDHKLYFVQNATIIISFMQNVQSERPIIFLHTWSYIPEHHISYLVLVKMVNILFMHDVINQTITTFIIYLSIYLYHPRVVYASLSSFRSWLFTWLARLFGMRDFPESNIHPESDD